MRTRLLMAIMDSWIAESINSGNRMIRRFGVASIGSRPVGAAKQQKSKGLGVEGGDK